MVDSKINKNNINSSNRGQIKNFNKRTSDICFEIIQFYPDSLMNLECLIIFKSENSSKIIQFENFFEFKATKYEFIHSSNLKDAVVDYKIYGGGDRKIYISGGSIVIKHYQFNHNSVKVYDRSFTCILTQEGKEFLYPCKNIVDQNAFIRLEITIKNNNFLKTPLNELIEKLKICNKDESDEVLIKNDSQTSFYKKNEIKLNDYDKSNIENKSFILNMTGYISPINRSKLNINFVELEDKKEVINVDEELNFILKENSNFDSFFENPELYYRSDYPIKKDLREAKYSSDKKKVLMMDLYSFQENYLDKIKKLKENAISLKTMIKKYKFEMYKIKIKYDKLSILKEAIYDRKLNLDKVSKEQETLNKLNTVNSNIFEFFKTSFKASYDKKDIKKAIQSKYKESEIKKVLIKVLNNCTTRSFKLLTKERLNQFTQLNSKYNFINIIELNNTINPPPFVRENHLAEEALDQEKFDQLYKQQKNEEKNLVRSISKVKSNAKKSVLYVSATRGNSKISNLISENKFSEFHNFAISRCQSNGEIFTELSFDEEEDEIANYFRAWSLANPEYQKFDVLKLSDNLYRLGKIKFIIQKNDDNFSHSSDDDILNKNYTVIDKNSKSDLYSFLLKNVKKKFKEPPKIIDNKLEEIKAKIKYERSMKANKKNKATI